MLGGERSFGAGDWADTELEKAMPVDFTIKNAKIRGVGALVMLMHACELPQGNHWEKVVARHAPVKFPKNLDNLECDKFDLVRRDVVLMPSCPDC